MPSYKLYYFPGRSVAEPIRQIFAYAGVEYEDIRVEKDKWPEYKPKMPFQQMPVLEVDGKAIPQSSAIARYVAKQFGLQGKDNFEAAWVDAIYDQYQDYWKFFAGFWYIHMGYAEGDIEPAREKYAEAAKLMIWPHIVKILKSNPSGYLVGDSVTWVDFLIAEHVTIVEEELPGFIKEYPELFVHAAKIRAIPQIKKWIETRPVTRG